MERNMGGHLHCRYSCESLAPVYLLFLLNLYKTTLMKKRHGQELQVTVNYICIAERTDIWLGCMQLLDWWTGLLDSYIFSLFVNWNVHTEWVGPTLCS